MLMLMSMLRVCSLGDDAVVHPWRERSEDTTIAKDCPDHDDLPDHEGPSQETTDNA